MITEETEWVSFIAKRNSIKDKISNSFKETNINFTKFSCIAVFEINNGSTTVDITKVNESDDSIIVTIENPVVGLTADIGQPFHIVKIPNTSKKFVFEKK